MTSTSDVLARYESGWPIRWIAAEAGRSYGWVYRQLQDAGVTMRPRGSSRRTAGEADPLVAGGEVSTLVMRLVRPGFRCLLGDEEDRRISARFGAPVGRLSKGAVPTGRAARAALVGALAGEPLALTVNQEGGRLNAADWPDLSLLPGAMALGAAGDPGLAREAGAAIGGQLRALGLTWNLAPVCDLYLGRGNPALGTRCFGSDPEQVAALAAAFVDGLEGAGVAATAKHFPGLGGVDVDPHAKVGRLDRLPRGALLPFEAAIAAGASAVMVGSHVVADVDDLPAVFSPRIVRGLLRDRLGFGGVVVTENLSIPALICAAGGIGEAAVRALEAGADLLMVDSEVSRRKPADVARHSNTALAVRRAAVVAAVVEAVQQGRLTRDRLLSSAARVDALVKRHGIAQPADLGDELALRAASRTASQVCLRVAQAAVTVVRGNARILPLRMPPGGVLGVIRVPAVRGLRADSSWQTPYVLPGLLTEFHPRIEAVTVDTNTSPGVPHAAKWEAVVVATHNACHGRHDHRITIGALVGQGRPVIHLATGDPADLTDTPAHVAIATYSPDPASVRAAVRTIFGAHHSTGALPVPARGDR
ncbi:glycoside hydrolase family 3 N-terminal domain-containing protein [Micromonospora sp. CA-263727]|uniref:glycoside hydrolase family 3 N-terminal domain-containing protein n=1 Tax=Micromonospora sp. CA-263727 TaxID=3239967 RepID=UPI003D94F796